MNLLQNLLMNVKAPLLDRTAYVAQPGFSGNIEEHYGLPIWSKDGENTRHNTFCDHIAYGVELSTDWQTPLEITLTVRKLVDMVLSDDGWFVNTGEDVDTGTYEIVIASDACRAISFETGIATNVALYRPHNPSGSFWRGKLAVPDQNQADFSEMGRIAEQHRSEGMYLHNKINVGDLLRGAEISIDDNPVTWFNFPRYRVVEVDEQSKSFTVEVLRQDGTVICDKDFGFYSGTFQKWAGADSRELPTNSDMLETFDTDVLIDELLKRCEDIKAPSSYHRKITKRALLNGLFMDVYDIDAMWPLHNSALTHGRKKLLNHGDIICGKSFEDDVSESIWSLGEGVKIYKEGVK